LIKATGKKRSSPVLTAFFFEYYKIFESVSNEIPCFGVDARVLVRLLEVTGQRCLARERDGRGEVFHRNALRSRRESAADHEQADGPKALAGAFSDYP
jgi:hypothetical protein